MNKDELFKVITNHACEVVPELEGHPFQHSDTLKGLGANSMDRSEIIMMTMESLSLQIPLVEFSSAQNIGELADIFYAKL